MPICTTIHRCHSFCVRCDEGLMNLFVMVIVDSFDALKNPFTGEIEKMMPVFAKAWAALDEKHVGRLSRQDMFKLVRCLPQPIGCAPHAKDGPVPFSHVRYIVAALEPADPEMVGTPFEMCFKDVMMQLSVIFIKGLRPRHEETLRAALLMQSAFRRAHHQRRMTAMGKVTLQLHRLRRDDDDDNDDTGRYGDDALAPAESGERGVGPSASYLNLMFCCAQEDDRRSKRHGERKAPREHMISVEA